MRSLTVQKHEGQISLPVRCTQTGNFYFPISTFRERLQFIYVIDGVAALKIGDDCFDLEPGDSVYYLSTVPHQIASKKGKATILAVLYGG